MPGYWRADGSYSDGSSDVQLTGSNVEVVWQAALAITDISAKMLPAIDVSSGAFGILIVSTLNQALDFTITAINDRGIAGYGVKSGGANLTINVPVSTSSQIYFQPNLVGARTIRSYMACTVAPASGSVTVYLLKKGAGL